MESLVERVAREERARVRFDIVLGEAAAAIVERASKDQSEQIVMGARGRSALVGLMLGSVAGKVVRAAPCRVLTVPGVKGRESKEQPLSAPKLERLLLPVDFSTNCEAAVEAGFELAATQGGTVDLLHVWEVPYYLPADLAVGVTERTLMSLAEEHARESMRALVAQLAEKGFSVERTHCTSGHPVSTIVKLAEQEGTMRIVMATQGRTGAFRWILGSVAEGVVQRAPCPVQVIHSSRGE